MIPHSKPTIFPNDYTQVKKILDSRLISSGNLNSTFQKVLSKRLDKEFVSLHSSGSTALYQILKAYNLGLGSKVLVPNYICKSVYDAVVSCGYKPVLYDNETSSWVTTFQKVKSSISKGTGAIILNHTFGISVPNLEQFRSLNIPIIEDCSQAFSPKERNTSISEYSDCSFYSFNATKLLTTGEGGAVATDNKILYTEIQNNKLDSGISDIGCSIGLNQLDRYHEFLDLRSEIANKYFAAFPVVSDKLKSMESLYFRFPILVNDITPYLSSKVVSYRRGVDQILNKEYRIKEEFANSEEIFKHTISIPIYPSLSNNEVELIINETKRILNESY